MPILFPNCANYLPVNNRFMDLKNQLALAYEGDAGKINEKLNTTSPIDEIFRAARNTLPVSTPAVWCSNLVSMRALPI